MGLREYAANKLGVDDLDGLFCVGRGAEEGFERIVGGLCIGGGHGWCVETRHGGGEPRD